MANTRGDEIDLDEELSTLPKAACKKADCAKNLHCFLQDKRDSKPVSGGKCRECGAELVTWSRVHQRRLQDAAYTFSMLRLEWIRHRFFHQPLTLRELNYAKRKGRSGMRDAAEKRVRDSVASENPFMDGAQTPWTGNILYYAQHATACCCRNCIAEWHGIPSGRGLNEDEIRYLTDLLCLYVNQRMPELTETGERIPAIRRKNPSPRG
jgi:hypothetical protein